MFIQYKTKQVNIHTVGDNNIGAAKMQNYVGVYIFSLSL